LSWRRSYQEKAGIDEKFLMLRRFELTEVFGVVHSLSYSIGELFEGTDDSHAKGILAKKIVEFEKNGWTNRGHEQAAIAKLMQAYCRVAIDPGESLNKLLNEWYPLHHSWALWGLDFALVIVVQF